MTNKHICGTCDHFLGCGDWDLCCGIQQRRLCYEDTEACEKWVNEKRKRVLSDGSKGANFVALFADGYPCTDHECFDRGNYHSTCWQCPKHKDNLKEGT